MLEKLPVSATRIDSLNGDEMEGLEYWRLCDELNIPQAALLIAGDDPSIHSEYVEHWEVEKRPVGYEAAKTAVSNALRSGKIVGTLVALYEYDINGNECGEVSHSIDLTKSRVEVESLRKWMAERGFRTGFFFPARNVSHEFLDPKNPRYAPKLAAAVLAWEATGNEASYGQVTKTSASQMAQRTCCGIGLTDEDGKPNETGIEEAGEGRELATHRRSPPRHHLDDRSKADPRCLG